MARIMENRATRSASSMSPAKGKSSLGSAFDEGPDEKMIKELLRSPKRTIPDAQVPTKGKFYPGVPLCTKPGQYYRIVKHGKSGASGFSLHPHYVLPLKGEVNPSHRDLARIKRRYGKRDSILQFIQSTADATSPLVTMQQEWINGTIHRAHSSVAVCQAVIEGAKVCRTNPNDPKCESAQYGLFFGYDLPRYGSPSLMKCGVPQGQLDKRVRHEGKLYSQWAMADYINRDNVELDSLTRDVLEPVREKYPVMSEGRLRYIKKIVEVAYEAGVSESALREIIYDLKMVHEDSDRFIYALRTVVHLRFSRKLHRDNLRRKGSGISRDFERFVAITEANIRSGAIGFRVMSAWRQAGTAGALYSARDNVMIFKRLNNIAAVLAGLSETVHEAYHSYQDAMKFKQTRKKAEGQAYERDMKAGLLLDRYQAERMTHDVRLFVPERMQEGMGYEMSAKEKIRFALCMGSRKEEIDEYQRDLKYKSTLYARALEGFERELDGNGPTDARREIEERAVFADYLHISESQDVYSYALSWLYDLGQYDALRDIAYAAEQRMSVSLRAMRKLPRGSVLRQRMTYRIMRESLLAHRSWQLIARGNRTQDAAAEKRLRAMRDVFELSDFSIWDEVSETPAKNDGI